MVCGERQYSQIKQESRMVGKPSHSSGLRKNWKGSSGLSELNSFLSSSFITGWNKAGPGCYTNFVHSNSLSVTFLMAIHF